MPQDNAARLRRFGLKGRGGTADGFDTNLAILDLHESFRVRRDVSVGASYSACSRTPVLDGSP